MKLRLEHFSLAALTQLRDQVWFEITFSSQQNGVSRVWLASMRVRPNRGEINEKVTYKRPTSEIYERSFIWVGITVSVFRRSEI